MSFLDAFSRCERNCLLISGTIQFLPFKLKGRVGALDVRKALPEDLMQIEVLSPLPELECNFNNKIERSERSRQHNAFDMTRRSMTSLFRTVAELSSPISIGSASC